MKENYGDLEALKILGKNKQNSFTTDQLIDKNLKNKDGESRLEVEQRMNDSFNKIISEYKGKKIAIVSHGAAIKFLLMNWCKLNKNKDLEYNNKIINVEYGSIIRLKFKDKKLIELSHLYK